MTSFPSILCKENWTHTCFAIINISNVLSQYQALINNEQNEYNISINVVIGNLILNKEFLLSELFAVERNVFQGKMVICPSNEIKYLISTELFDNRNLSF